MGPLLMFCHRITLALKTRVFLPWTVKTVDRDLSTEWVFTCSVDHPHPPPPPSRGRKLIVNTINSPLPWREGVRGEGEEVAQFKWYSFD